MNRNKCSVVDFKFFFRAEIICLCYLDDCVSELCGSCNVFPGLRFRSCFATLRAIFV